MNQVPGADSFATSLTLLQRVRAKDRNAWTVFAQLYGPVLYRWARVFGLQDADAADVAQDVLMVAAGKIEAFQRDQPGQSLRGWLRTITKNKCRDLLRARQRQATATGGTDAQLMLGKIADESNGEGADERNDDDGVDAEASVVHAAVELLKADFEERTWQAFVQTSVEGRKASDVAADLKMSVGSVYTAKSRVLSRLRTEFQGLL